eukprot:CCRYP_002512-RD/>CCRYP_002512-RD protein AED:0.35 eAED:1.00 QI:0/0/0/1/1/1/2/0/449
MASMRYVRDGSNHAQTHTNTANQIGNSNGKNRTCYERAGHGRGHVFSGRGRGRGRIPSHSFVSPAISKPHRSIIGNKWVRTSGDSLLEASAGADAGRSNEFPSGVDSTLSGNQCTEVTDPIDHSTIESSIEHVAEKSELSTSKNFEKRGKHKLVLKNAVSTNLENTTGNKTEMSNSVMDFASENKAVNDNSNGMALKKLGKNKLVLQKDDSVNFAGKNIDNNKQIQNSCQLHTISKERVERRGHEKLALKQDTVEEVSEPYSTGDGLPKRSKPSFTWSRESSNQPADLASSTCTKKTFNQAGFAKKRKPPNTQYDASSKGSRRIYLNTTLPTKETSACDLESEKCEIETEKSSEVTLTVNSTVKKLTDYCYRDTGRGRGGTSIGGEQHIPSGRSTRKGNMGLVRWDAEVCPMFETLGYCENPDCVLRHVVAKKGTEGKNASTVKSFSRH